MPGAPAMQRRRNASSTSHPPPHCAQGKTCKRATICWVSLVARRRNHRRADPLGRASTSLARAGVHFSGRLCRGSLLAAQPLRAFPGARGSAGECQIAAQARQSRLRHAVLLLQLKF